VSRGSSPASSSGNNPAISGSHPSVPGSANSPASRDSRRRMSGSLPAIRLGDADKPSTEGEPRPSSSSNPKR
jgi:hypothetical protein